MDLERGKTFGRGCVEGLVELGSELWDARNYGRFALLVVLGLCPGDLADDEEMAFDEGVELVKEVDPEVPVVDISADPRVIVPEGIEKEEFIRRTRVITEKVVTDGDLMSFEVGNNQGGNLLSLDAWFKKLGAYFLENGLRLDPPSRELKDYVKSSNIVLNAGGYHLVAYRISEEVSGLNLYPIEQNASGRVSFEEDGILFSILILGRGLMGKDDDYLPDIGDTKAFTVDKFQDSILVPNHRFYGAEISEVQKNALFFHEAIHILWRHLFPVSWVNIDLSFEADGLELRFGDAAFKLDGEYDVGEVDELMTYGAEFAVEPDVERYEKFLSLAEEYKGREDVMNVPYGLFFECLPLAVPDGDLTRDDVRRAGHMMFINGFKLSYFLESWLNPT